MLSPIEKEINLTLKDEQPSFFLSVKLRGMLGNPVSNIVPGAYQMAQNAFLWPGAICLSTGQNPTTLDLSTSH